MQAKVCQEKYHDSGFLCYYPKGIVRIVLFDENYFPIFPSPSL